LLSFDLYYIHTNKIPTYVYNMNYALNDQMNSIISIRIFGTLKTVSQLNSLGFKIFGN